jgi:hypothetical protein
LYNALDFFLSYHLFLTAAFLNNDYSSIVNSLSDFSPIYLEDLSGARLMNRVDTKFVFHISRLEEILKELVDHYAVLEVDGNRISNYESRYLDEANFRFYLAHHNGKDHRFKVRYRKYVDTNTVFLEVKEKRKGRTVKKRILVDAIKNSFTPEERSFVASFLDGGELEATMSNAYQRIALVDEKGSERVTLDLNLNYHWEGENKNFANLVIAELKQERINCNTLFYQIMRTKHIRPLRISKYCTGLAVLRTQDVQKVNRFKSKMLTLKKINNVT